MLSAVKSFSPEDAREAAAFGPRLRRLRKIADLTLKELSDRARLATSTISKIENDRMSPTYDVLLKLAAGLAIDLSSLLEGPATVQASGRLDVTRAAERRKHPTGTYIYEPFATGLTRKGMDPTVVRVTARSIDEFPDLIRHPGEELVFVISGTVELHAEFYAPIRLEAGDSVYYDATMGHAYISVSPEDATILNIVCGTGGVPPVELPGAQR
jgi:transcriptional regulator with XRE-family HTH domain